MFNWEDVLLADFGHSLVMGHMSIYQLIESGPIFNLSQKCLKSMKARFEFYEQVRISSPGVSCSQFIGRLGVILGRTETTEGDSWYYTVAVDGEAECWCFFEWELEATGRFFTRADFYNDDAIRVQVDETGRGFIDPDTLD